VGEKGRQDTVTTNSSHPKPRKTFTGSKMNIRRTAIAVAIGVALIAIAIGVYEEWRRHQWADAWSKSHTESGTE
jgi:hypothetical protein